MPYNTSGFRRPRTMSALLLAVVFAVLCPHSWATDWPGSRGPQGDGKGVGEVNVDTWSSQENIVWKASVPGEGWSPRSYRTTAYITAAYQSDRDCRMIEAIHWSLYGCTILLALFSMHVVVSLCQDVGTGRQAIFRLTLLIGFSWRRGPYWMAQFGETPFDFGRHVLRCWIVGASFVLLGLLTASFKTDRRSKFRVFLGLAGLVVGCSAIYTAPPTFGRKSKENSPKSSWRRLRRRL